MTKVRLGIIGVGNMGSGHLPISLAGKCPGIELTAVADRREAAANEPRTHLPEAPPFSRRGSDLISVRPVRRRCICPSLPASRWPWRRGRPARHDEARERLRKAVREMDRPPKERQGLYHDVQQRTNCVYRKMQMVHSGQLGELKRSPTGSSPTGTAQIYYDSGDWRATWKAKAAALTNQCPTSWTPLLRWICGLPRRCRPSARRVSGTTSRWRTTSPPYLQFANGATGVFRHHHRRRPPAPSRFEVTGTLGEAGVRNDNSPFWKLAQDEREFCRTATEGLCPAQMPAGGEWRPTARTCSTWACSMPLPGRSSTARLWWPRALRAWAAEAASNAAAPLQLAGPRRGHPFDEELFLSELNKRRATSRKKGDKHHTSPPKAPIEEAPGTQDCTLRGFSDEMRRSWLYSWPPSEVGPLHIESCGRPLGKCLGLFPQQA